MKTRLQNHIEMTESAYNQKIKELINEKKKAIDLLWENAILTGTLKQDLETPIG